MFSESNSKTLLPGTIFSTISRMCSICPLSVAAHTHGGWDCRGLYQEQIWTDEPSWVAKGTLKKKTFFPLRKDEETISEVGMVDWISKCEFIAGGRIAQWFITLALESKGGRVAQRFITMALESKGQVYAFSTQTPSLYDVHEFLNLLELQFLHL